MTIARSPAGRHFTEAAREAAKAARVRKKEIKKNPRRPEVFVVRGAQDARLFTWEIRRFGGVLLQDSSARFISVGAAEIAGQQALSAFVIRP